MTRERSVKLRCPSCNVVTSQWTIDISRAHPVAVIEPRWLLREHIELMNGGALSIACPRKRCNYQRRATRHNLQRGLVAAAERDADSITLDELHSV